MKREKGQARANSKCQGGNLPCHPSPLHPLPLTSQLTGSSVQSFPAAPLATCSRNFSRAAAPKGLNSVSVMRIRTCRGRSRGGGACADADKEGEEEGTNDGSKEGDKEGEVVGENDGVVVGLNDGLGVGKGVG